MRFICLMLNGCIRSIRIIQKFFMRYLISDVVRAEQGMDCFSSQHKTQLGDSVKPCFLKFVYSEKATHKWEAFSFFHSKNSHHFCKSCSRHRIHIHHARQFSFASKHNRRRTNKDVDHYLKLWKRVPFFLSKRHADLFKTS